MKTKHIYTFANLLFLALTSVVTVATSKQPDGEPSYGKPEDARYAYSSSSNCNSAIQGSVSIVVDGYGKIVTPTDITFYDLGMPRPMLMPGATPVVSSTDKNGVTRKCTESSPRNMLTRYSCTDNDVWVCDVDFEFVNAN